ncbi:MAG: hypothetical protein A3J27_11085 [Candidatus Tectomicrobia bacterium RIFCSPLOWO2_12_FULL_69_37]|nr:MAG: hypothetical protein A3J27_11085 [Candidatus Tectomicrobia bacterium RIFCSPLOWO2_12_FULL_69_37]
MSDQAEKRVFARFRIPVVVDAPELSDFPLVPGDVSANGFKVVVGKQPRVGGAFPCSIQIAQEMFGDCEGAIAWVRKGPAGSPSWEVGISVQTRDEARVRLASLLEELSAQFGRSASSVPDA